MSHEQLDCGSTVKTAAMQAGLTVADVKADCLVENGVFGVDGTFYSYSSNPPRRSLWLPGKCLAAQQQLMTETPQGIQFVYSIRISPCNQDAHIGYA